MTRTFSSQMRMIKCLIILGSVFQSHAQSSDNKSGYSVQTGHPVTLSGVAQFRLRSRQDKADGFDVRRARLSLKGQLGERISLKIQNEFGGSVQKLLDADLAYKLNGSLTLHAGQFKIPFSLENLTSSSALATINRSQVVEALAARSRDVQGNQNGRDIGLQINEKNRILDASIGLFNGSGINTADDNHDKDISGRLVFHPFGSLWVGGSFYTGRSTSAGSTVTSDRKRMGMEMSCTVAGADISAEYILGSDDTTDKSGWYTQAVYDILPDRLSAVIKFDEYDPNLNQNDDSASVITAGCVFFMQKGCKIELNIELKSEEVKKDNHAFLAQMQIAF